MKRRKKIEEREVEGDGEEWKSMRSKQEEDEKKAAVQRWEGPVKVYASERRKEKERDERDERSCLR